MNKFPILIIISLISFDLAAQSYFRYENVYKVVSDNGVILRTKSTTESDPLIAVPYGEYVGVNQESIQKKDTINGKAGKWLAAVFKNRFGYIFSPYLKEESVPEFLTRQDLGMISYYGEPDVKKFIETNPTLLGFFRKGPSCSNCIREIDTQGLFDELLHNATTRDPKRKEYEQLFFVYTDDKLEPIIRATNFSLGIGSRKIFYFDHDSIRGQYAIYALADVVINENDIDPISAVKNYQLILRNLSDSTVTEQTLITLSSENRDYPLECCYDLHNTININWVGDVDGDGEIDLYCSISGPEWYTNYLFLSSYAEEGKLVRSITSVWSS